MMGAAYPRAEALGGEHDAVMVTTRSGHGLSLTATRVRGVASVLGQVLDRASSSIHPMGQHGDRPVQAIEAGTTSRSHGRGHDALSQARKLRSHRFGVRAGNDDLRRGGR